MEAIKVMATIAMHGRKPLEGALFCRMIFYLRRPQKHYDSKGNIRERLLEKRHITKPDVDNLNKIVQDAMEGICFVNDSQIVVLHISKVYHERGTCTIVFISEFKEEER